MLHAKYTRVNHALVCCNCIIGLLGACDLYWSEFGHEYLSYVRIPVKQTRIIMVNSTRIILQQTPISVSCVHIACDVRILRKWFMLLVFIGTWNSTNFVVIILHFLLLSFANEELYQNYSRDKPLFHVESEPGVVTTGSSITYIHRI